MGRAVILPCKHRNEGNSQLRIISSSTTLSDAILSSPKSKFLYFDFLCCSETLFQELFQPCSEQWAATPTHTFNVGDSNGHSLSYLHPKCQNSSW